MVYRGRPSTGCKRCRERKVKCDERPGGCVKCEERRITCPGYDRTVNDFFHDETAKVQAKAKLSKARSMRIKDDHEIWESVLVPANVCEAPRMHLLAPLVDQGFSFFMAHHAVGMDQPSIASHAYNKHLSTGGFHPLVATTMTALGIAGVANLYKDPALKREATRWYLDAIKMANAAISSSKTAREDTTLFSVNLLTIFEATFNENSFSGWSNHVDGASLLVKLRGKDQIYTSAGRRLYLHTIGLLAINCMGKGVPMPDYVNEINNEITGHLDDGDPRTAYFFLHLKTTDLRAQILNQKIVDLRKIIEAATELDRIAQSIFANAGEQWNYDTVPCFDEIPGVFGRYYHVYPVHTTAQTWNWVRYNRIYFHDIIRNCILAGLATSPPVLGGVEYTIQLGESTRILQQLQADILASMPQFLHDTPMFTPRNHSKTYASEYPSKELESVAKSTSTSILMAPLIPPASRGHSSVPRQNDKDQKLFFQNFQNDTVEFSKHLLDRDSSVERLPIVRISGGYSTVWALYVAGSMPTASPSSQDYVLHCLTRIEHEFGIKQAAVFAKALRIKRRMDNSGETPLSLCPQYLPPDSGQDMPYEESESKVTEI